MSRRSPRRRALARAEEIEYDRILYFSDAIFAIAITLLVVDLQVPDAPNLQSGTQLRESIPRIGGFALSFAVIGLFWLGHHGLFRHIKGLDRSLILLNLLFLGCIAFLPYPTSLLSAAGDQVPATIFYAVSIAAAGLAEAAVWLYAIHIRDLALPGVPPTVHRWVLLRILLTPAVFLLSIPLAIRQPTLAQRLWLLVLFSALVIRRLEPPRPTGQPPTATTAPSRSERWSRCRRPGRLHDRQPGPPPRGFPVAPATSGRGGRRRRTAAGWAAGSASADGRRERPA